MSITNDDSISRQAVLDLLNTWADGYPYIELPTEDALKAVRELPLQVIEDRPKGRWLIDLHSMIMKCSQCGNIETAKKVGIVDADKRFCSHCGAYMGAKK